MLIHLGINLDKERKKLSHELTVIFIVCIILKAKSFFS